MLIELMNSLCDSNSNIQAGVRIARVKVRWRICYFKLNVRAKRISKCNLGIHQILCVKLEKITGITPNI